MKRILAAVAAVAVLLPVQAFAAEEPAPPSPSIGEPVITIPVDTQEIAQLIVTDVALSPTVGLLPGDAVRLLARIAAGSAPRRTVIVIDGVGEIVGDVPVAADGSIDHEFILPAKLAAGTHRLSLAAVELGIASIGVIEVAQPANPAPPTTAAESDPAAPATTVPGPQAVTQPGSDGRSLAFSLTIAAGLLLGLVVLAIALTRRRTHAVARFEGAASLPTATHTVLGTLHEDDAAPTAPTAPTDATPDHPEPETPQTQDDTPSQPEGNGPGAHLAKLLLVELTAATGLEDDVPPTELVLGSFDDAEQAKAAARKVRQASESDRSEEVWWEVRSPERGPIWMIHAWAPREYHINSETGEATSASH